MFIYNYKESKSSVSSAYLDRGGLCSVCWVSRSNSTEIINTRDYDEAMIGACVLPRGFGVLYNYSKKLKFTNDWYREILFEYNIPLELCENYIYWEKHKKDEVPNYTVRSSPQKNNATVPGPV